MPKENKMKKDKKQNKAQLTRTLSITYVRKNLSSVINSLQGNHKVIITQKGKPAAVLMSHKEWESIDALLTLAKNPKEFIKTLEAHQKYRREKKDELPDMEELFKNTKPE